MSLHHRRTSTSNKKSSIKTLGSPSSTHCIYSLSVPTTSFLRRHDVCPDARSRSRSRPRSDRLLLRRSVEYSPPSIQDSFYSIPSPSSAVSQLPGFHRLIASDPPAFTTFPVPPV